MAQSTGSNFEVGVATEDAFGVTPASPNGIKLYLTGSTVSGKRGKMNSDILRSTRQPFKPVDGNLDISGSLSGYVDGQSFGFFLKNILGAPTTTGAGTFTHVFKAGGVIPAGMLIEHNHKNLATGNFDLFNGCKINNLNIELPQEGYVTASVDVIGAKETNSNTSFDGTLTDLGHNPFSGFDATIKEGGASIATVSNISIAIAANLDGSQYTIDGGGGARTGIPLGMYAVTGSFDALFEDRTLLNKAINGTESSLNIVLSHGAADSVTFDIPELVYERKGVEVSGAAGVKQSLSFTAFYANHADAAAIKATIINSIASY